MSKVMTRGFFNLIFAAFFFVVSMQSQAGLQEGIAAYKKGQYPVAWKELKPLADNGDARAQAIIGKMYSGGAGVQQDHKEAALWLHKAAGQGDADAQITLGVMYERGIGVPQNGKEAVSWYRKAAEQGTTEAQYILGGIYQKGLQGVLVDLVQAHKWFDLAAAAGFEIAQQDLNEVAAMMSREQVEEARSMAKEWLAKHK